MEYERCKNDWCINEAMETLCPFAMDVDNKKIICNCCLNCRQECENDI